MLGSKDKRMAPTEAVDHQGAFATRGSLNFISMQEVHVDKYGHNQLLRTRSFECFVRGSQVAGSFRIEVPKAGWQSSDSKKFSVKSRNQKAGILKPISLNKDG
jgi:hypothetical protein